MSERTLGSPEGIEPAPGDTGGEEGRSPGGREVGAPGDAEARDVVVGDEMAAPGLARRPVTKSLAFDNAFLNPKRERGESDVSSWRLDTERERGSGEGVWAATGTDGSGGGREAVERFS